MQAARGTPLNLPSGSTTSARHPSAHRYIRAFAALATAVYLGDVISKALAVARLEGRAPVELLGGLLTLRLTRNPGAAFSLGTGYTVILTSVAIGVAFVVVRLSSRLGSTGWAAALGLLLGGACGNLTDRLVRSPGPLRGYVVDFLELPHWPVFNLADSAIVAGAALVVLQSLRGVRLDGSRG